MRTFRDAKIMAKALRQGLGKKRIELSHSECLELVARQFDCENWHVLSARIETASAANTSSLRLPDGWIVSGSRPELYEMGVDPDMPGSPAIIRSLSMEEPAGRGGFGTLMQSIQAAGFRGMNLRLSAELKTEDVRGSGTLWMRIDRGPGNTLRFDNMEGPRADGSLKGSHDWTRREIILDVPDDAESVHFGFYLYGTGCVLARNVELVEADEQAMAGRRTYPERPTNLGFTQVSAG
jgi:hypothetical protein